MGHAVGLFLGMFIAAVVIWTLFAELPIMLIETIFKTERGREIWYSVIVVVFLALLFCGAYSDFAKLY